MSTLVAFASLPFGLKGGEYRTVGPGGNAIVYVSELSYNPILTITSRPELAQSIPRDGRSEGFTSYTWFDHPFVLRVMFGRNVASLGAINSYATLLQPISERVNYRDEKQLAPLREDFAEDALVTLNHLVGIVRRNARLYHVSDLRRDDLDVTVRAESGDVLSEDPLQTMLLAEEQEQTDTETFDLLQRGDNWYQTLADDLLKPRAVPLAENLVMEAERALLQRFPRQTVTTCHSALETAVSALLARGMKRRRLEDREVDHILSIKNLASKLDSLLRKYTGFSLRRDNPSLWDDFKMLTDLRNDIVHRGMSPTYDEAREVVATTRELLDWLAIVRSRNK